MNDKSTIKVFISYAHNNRPYFKIFMESLQRFVKISDKYHWHIWSDESILTGSFWDDEIQERLGNADIAVLLVCDSFLASDYIKDKEFNTIVERFNHQDLLIAPLLFAPCDYRKWSLLARHQFFMPEGSRYGRPDLKDFTFADLVKFRETDGAVIPNPNIARYVKDFVHALEKAFEAHKNKACAAAGMDMDETLACEVGEPGKHINRVPHYNIGDLVGRREILRRIHQTFEQGNGIVLLDGIAGIGKTSVALAYANHPVFSRHYRRIAWVSVIGNIRYDLMQSLANEETRFTYNSQLPEDVNFAKFTKCLQSFQGNSLLVIDNADSPDQLTQIKDDLHQLGWRILITSRAKLKYLTGISLEELNNADAKKLFYRYFEKSTENDILEKILKQIENHTLLVELLAKAGNENPFLTDCRQIYDLLSKQGLMAEDLKINISIGTREDNLYNYVTAMVSPKNLTEVEQQYMRYFSVLPSFEILISDLADFFQVPPAGRIDFANTLNGLVKKGWLTANRNAYKCHQLIQTAIRAHLPPTGENYKELIASLVKKLKWKYSDKETFVEKSRFLPFAESVWNRLKRENEDIADLGYELAKSYCRLRDIRKAHELIKMVVELREKIYPGNHPKLASSYDQYAFILWKWGNYSEAIGIAKTAIRIIEQYPVEKYYKEYITFYNTLAVNERRNGLYADAIEHLEYSIETLIKHFTGNLIQREVKLSRYYNNLAWVYRSLEDYGKCEYYFRQSLILTEKQLPKDHPSLALCHVNYGWIMVKLEQYGDAQFHLDRAMAIKKLYFEDDNLTFCPVFRNYAVLFNETGEQQKAKEYIQKAINLAKSGLNREHQSIAGYYKVWAEIEAKMDNYSQCLAFTQKAIDIYESQHPKGHPELEKYRQYYRKIAKNAQTIIPAITL